MQRERSCTCREQGRRAGGAQGRKEPLPLPPPLCTPGPPSRARRHRACAHLYTCTPLTSHLAPCTSLPDVACLYATSDPVSPSPVSHPRPRLRLCYLLEPVAVAHASAAALRAMVAPQHPGSQGCLPHLDACLFVLAIHRRTHPSPSCYRILGCLCHGSSSRTLARLPRYAKPRLR